MKYNTISTSSLSTEGKISTISTYSENNNFASEKMQSSTIEVSLIRGELELVQRALKLQTRRCRQLVAEYTKRLQLTEQQYQAEKRLRDEQLARVLRALLVFEARLRQEQKFIKHQLEEKDYTIKKQQVAIQKIVSNHYCKNCNQYYNPSSNLLESLDSSSEYVVTDYQDYQSSNFESLDSSSETYTSISEKDKIPDSSRSISSEDNVQTERTCFGRGRRDSLGRRGKRIVHRKGGSYFEMRNDNQSLSSNDDNTSNDYENLELPEKGKLDAAVNDNEKEDHNSDSLEATPCNTTVILNDRSLTQESESPGSKISQTIPVFDGDCETNDNWYASASDQEDEEQRDVYRNNPVLECMNQILMQNINDPLVSPPKTPNMEKKGRNNSGKKVKFSDEEDNKSLTENKTNSNESESDYYETPVQRVPNFYETPQSIYSNDYEQILSQCNETFNKNYSANTIKTSEANILKLFKKKFEPVDKALNHYYVDMDTKSEQDEKEVGNVVMRKSKIVRPAPALPPKPANLTSKYKIQEYSKDKHSEKSFDSEPDYCSISEINLPTASDKTCSFKNKITVVAQINTETAPKRATSMLLEKNVLSHDLTPSSPPPAQYRPVSLSDPIPAGPNTSVRKSVEKLNIQIANQTAPIKQLDSPKKACPSPEIPKLPHVTEIIIPEETEPKSEESISINQDNYVKNNTQILKQKANHTDRIRPIQMGSTVSSLIASFNNKQLISEINQQPANKHKITKSFENLQNLESPLYQESFDLSQNFEEFKLDDCEIEDYNAENTPDVDLNSLETRRLERVQASKVLPRNLSFGSSTRVEMVRATNELIVPQLNINSLQQLKKKLELEKNRVCVADGGKNEGATTMTHSSEPTYEHFLECTGLSSKSILTPTRLLSNHKSMLKPKDVKLRSRVKANNGFERQSNATVKYWSEPYL